MFTRASLKKLWPKASADTISGIMAVAGDAFTQNNMTDDLSVAQFMAQISHECGAGTIVRENMNYSADRMMAIFGVGHHSAAVTAAEAQRLAHKPKDIAERVYGLGNPKKAKELGNTQAGDGFKFRGGGMLQLTGRASYARFGTVAGVDLTVNPDAIADPQVSFKVAVAEFIALGCLPFALKDDVRQVTRRVNGGFNGLAERTAWLAKWKAALAGDKSVAADQAPVPAPRGAEGPGVIATLAKSKIVKSAGAGIVLEGGDALSKAGDTLDQVGRVKDGADHLGLMDKLGALASNPRLWVAVGIIVVLGLVIYWRWRDHR